MPLNGKIVNWNHNSLNKWLVVQNESDVKSPEFDHSHLISSSNSVLSIMNKKEIDIEIDRLINSIEDSVTGEIFDANVV